MKLDTQLTIDDVEYRVIDYDVQLGLSEIGRAVFVIQSELKPSTGTVVFNCGYKGAGFYRYFIGSARRIVRSAGNSWAVHCRELSMVLEMTCPISLRNCTMLDVLADIERRTLIKFSGSETLGSYASAKVPRFAHSGSALHAVQALADVFNIPDFIWLQDAEAKVWCGSSEDSFAAKHDNITIPDSFFTQQQAANMATLPALPVVRPGTQINGERITAVRLHDHEVQLTWIG